MAKKQFPLLYALKNGESVFVDDVENGKACACVCPACNKPLIAKQGKKGRTHHFAHAPGTDCEYGYETSLHLAAKSVLATAKEMVIPPVYIHFPFSCKPSVLLQEAQTLPISKVELETHFDGIIPDVVVYSGNHKFFVEIYVTHSIDEEKLQKIKTHQISTVEIDLSDRTDPVSLEELSDVLLNNSTQKQWKYSVKAENWYRKYLSVSEKREITKKDELIYWWHIYDCPIATRMWDGKMYADLGNDCMRCPYCIENHKKEGYILCSGKHRIADQHDFSIDEHERTKGKQDSEKKRYNTRLAYLEQNLRKNIAFPCPNCGCILNEKKGTQGSYWGCSMYPKCKFLIWEKEDGSFYSPKLKENK